MTLADLRRCVGLFTHRRVVVRHFGVLVDQPAVADAIDAAVAAAERHGWIVDGVLARTTVRVVAEAPDGMPARAEWTGGWFDRGLVTVEAGDGLPGRVVSALGALIMDHNGIAGSMRSAPTVY